MDDNNYLEALQDEKITNVDIEREVKKSFIEYAMSVIIARALPDVRDGLKPVHRRILYAMYEDHLTHDNQFRKSATTVGNVLGRYHPHGDVAVYDAMVRMAQVFSLRYPLIEGHGNFGNIDGDGPAAYRYTESRLSRLADYMLEGLEKEVVSFSPNFDNKLMEPDVLPSRFPNLLVNGSVGIAVGMATNIPPHNLTEVIDAVCALIDDPGLSIPDLMRYVKGPDFPTYGTIYGTRGITEAYMTGRGRIALRAEAQIETTRHSTKIIVTELPYQVNKANLIINIAQLVRDKRIEGISGLNDESGRAGLRIAIDVKRDANPQVVLNLLYKFTQMQDTCAVNMLALVNGEPKLLNLKQVLEHYIAHQVDVIERRTVYDRDRAQRRLHILEGLKIALDNIDETIRIIRASRSVPEAKEALIKRFELSDVQGQAIVDMPLGRLAGLEIEKILEEMDALRAVIAELNGILADRAVLMGVIKKEILEIRDKFGDERRTRIEQSGDDIVLEDLIERRQCIVTMTQSGYIKRMCADAYQAQKRGGRGMAGMTTKEDDEVHDIFAVHSHDWVMMFTTAGRVYAKKCYEIPESSRTAKGTHIANLVELQPDESITAVMDVHDFSRGYIVMLTRRGVVKRSRLARFANIRKAGLIAIDLAEGDSLLSAERTSGGDCVVVATKNGIGLRFSEKCVREMGRGAHGVRGIRLVGDDEVVGTAIERNENYIGEVVDTETVEIEVSESGEMEVVEEVEEVEIIEPETESDGEGEELAECLLNAEEPQSSQWLLSITERGFGKRCRFSGFTLRNRGGRGMTLHKLSGKTGKLAGIAAVDESDDILIVTGEGTVIRTPVSQIPAYNSRGTSGVIVMRTTAEASVIGFTRIPAAPAEEEAETETAAEAAVDEAAAGEGAGAMGDVMDEDSPESDE